MKPVPPIIIELMQRLFASNPKFFKWLQLLSATVAIVAFIPDVAAWLGVTLPSWASVLNEATIKVGSLTAMLMAQLPNNDSK